MNPPKYLYKYRCWDDEKKHQHDKDILAENKIYFASANKFNDPYDCKLPISISKMSTEELFKINGVNLDADQSKFFKSADDLLKRNNKNEDWDKFDQRQMDFVENNLGIFSVSRKCDILQMWSLYSDKHQGFCVGLNITALQNFFGNKSSNSDYYIRMHEAIYEEDFPDLMPTSRNDLEVYIKNSRQSKDNGILKMK